MATTQKVHIVGPNLVDQSKGSFHVHAVGCGDMKRMAKRDPEFALELEQEASASEYCTLTEICDAVYDPDDFECESGEYLNDFHFAPCVKLPVK
jgi:hypothetical protein